MTSQGNENTRTSIYCAEDKKGGVLFISSYLDLKRVVTFIMAAIWRYEVSVLRSTFVKQVESDVIYCLTSSYLFAFGSLGISGTSDS